MKVLRFITIMVVSLSLVAGSAYAQQAAISDADFFEWIKSKRADFLARYLLSEAGGNKYQATDADLTYQQQVLNLLEIAEEHLVEVYEPETYALTSCTITEEGFLMFGFDVDEGSTSDVVVDPGTGVVRRSSRTDFAYYSYGPVSSMTVGSREYDETGALIESRVTTEMYAYRDGKVYWKKVSVRVKDKEGRVVESRYDTYIPNDSGELFVAFSWGHTRTYDEEGKLKQSETITLKHDQNGLTSRRVEKRTFEYDAAGRSTRSVLQIDEYDGDGNCLNYSRGESTCQYTEEGEFLRMDGWTRHYDGEDNLTGRETEMMLYEYYASGCLKTIIQSRCFYDATDLNYRKVDFRYNFGDNYSFLGYTENIYTQTHEEGVRRTRTQEHREYDSKFKLESSFLRETVYYLNEDGTTSAWYDMMTNFDANGKVTNKEAVILAMGSSSFYFYEVEYEVDENGDVVSTHVYDRLLGTEVTELGGDGFIHPEDMIEQIGFMVEMREYLAEELGVHVSEVEYDASYTMNMHVVHGSGDDAIIGTQLGVDVKVVVLKHQGKEYFVKASRVVYPGAEWIKETLADDDPLAMGAKAKRKLMDSLGVGDKDLRYAGYMILEASTGARAHVAKFLDNDGVMHYVTMKLPGEISIDILLPENMKGGPDPVIESTEKMDPVSPQFDEVLAMKVVEEKSMERARDIRFTGEMKDEQACTPFEQLTGIKEASPAE